MMRPPPSGVRYQVILAVLLNFRNWPGTEVCELQAVYDSIAAFTTLMSCLRH
jgi:hypothetical protein